MYLPSIVYSKLFWSFSLKFITDMYCNLRLRLVITTNIILKAHLIGICLILRCCNFLQTSFLLIVCNYGAYFGFGSHLGFRHRSWDSPYVVGLLCRRKLLFNYIYFFLHFPLIFRTLSLSQCIIGIFVFTAFSVVAPSVDLLLRHRFVYITG